MVKTFCAVQSGPGHRGIFFIISVPVCCSDIKGQSCISWWTEKFGQINHVTLSVYFLCVYQIHVNWCLFVLSFVRCLLAVAGYVVCVCVFYLCVCVCVCAFVFVWSVCDCLCVACSQRQVALSKVIFLFVAWPRR